MKPASFPIEKWLYGLAIALCVPALLINLGLLALIDDESIRALVALEMKLSGNYIVPTLHGAFYYNKPPLYNWLLLLFFELSGSVNEWTARIPTVLFLMGYAGTVFYFFRRHFSFHIAFLNAFFLITCGRILFYDSMLGLIDTCFSWVVFTSFMVLYHQGERQNWGRLFLLTYLLTAVGFMMKGLPAVVFQGISLLTWLAYKRQFMRLFSWQHIASGLLFLAIVGSYYWAYAQYHALDEVFYNLFNESSKRTVVQFGWGETLLHFFSFPFEMIYHFLPWTVMVIYFFKKGSWDRIRQHPFIVFNLLIFIANILIYWTSPQVYARYLLMFIPLIFSSFLYLHEWHREEKTWQYKAIHYLLLAFCVVSLIGAFVPPFWDRLAIVPQRWLKSLVLGFSLLALTLVYWRWASMRLLTAILVFLVFRIGFNWFVLPDRVREDFGSLCRESSLEMGAQFAAYPLYVHPVSFPLMQTTNSFYLTKARGQIIEKAPPDIPKDAYYIIAPQAIPRVPYEKKGEFMVRHGKYPCDIGILIPEN